jgi:signal transduction histidine kinase/CheY-like chemotaxis protein
MSPEEELDLLRKRLSREKRARRRAEQLLEEKSRELYVSNLSLANAGERLNQQVRERTLELEAARTRAQEQAEYLTTILDAISQGVSVFDAELRLQTWNANLARLMALPPVLLREGRPVEDVLRHCAARGDYGDGDIEELVRERLDGLRKMERTGSFREARERWDGRHIQLAGRVLPGGAIVTTYADITDQKRTEQTLERQKAELARRVEELQALRRSLEEAHELAQAANRTKSRFVAMISHDIRTPVNGLLGTLLLLEQTGLTEEQRKLLSLSLSSGEQLRGLLADLIDLSQADAGAIRLEVAPISLHEFVETTAAHWRTAAADKGLAFSVVCAPGLPGAVLGDAGRLRQVLENLLSNAVKYCEQGQISLHVDTVPTGVRFRVQDSGYGIAPDDQSKLFQDFTRLERTAGNAGGFGLGLAISRHLVDLMDGELSLQSELGVGSCFSLVVPLPEVGVGVAPAPPASWSDRVLVTRNGNPPHVLIVEDVETNQLIARAYLEKMGASAAIATNGREGVEAVMRHAVDLVLMDANMPVMDGFEAIRRIRSLPGGASTIPIVMATAYADGDTRTRAAALGVQGFVEKPIQPAVLGRVLQRALTGEDEVVAAAGDVPADSSVAIERAVLAEMLDGVGVDAASRLIEMALRDLNDTLHVVESADEMENLARAAHKLKSLGPSFGAMRTGECAAGLDAACAGGAETATLHALRQALVAEGRRAVEAIERYREELSSATAFS